VSPLRPQHLPPVDLADLAAALGLTAPESFTGVPVRGITLASDDVVAGDLFAAVPGLHQHGSKFAGSAVAAGAVAILTDEDGATASAALGVPVLVVDKPRAVLGPIASAVYGDPSRAMTLIGVTGTNGKTTTAYLLEAAMAATGATTALLGTIETRIAGERLPQARTTPEAPDLQALLAVARERGVTAAAMEVSSHALALGRVTGTRFAAGVFTNLSQDHLDFHLTMQAYFDAKAKLFHPDVLDTAVICVDDEWGERLMERVRLPHVTYSARGVVWADWTVEVHGSDGSGTDVVALGPAGERIPMRVPIPGRVNIANALGALAASVACGLDAHVAAAGIGSLAGVPGRLEGVHAGQAFTALVDYAHTPDAVASLLEALREVTPGRLVIVLGCGGDRDRAKRRPMARAAAEGSDLAIFTSDNPRSEAPEDILAEMTAGLELPYIREVDRAIAIALAIAGLGEGDTVVVAGKGHETGQEHAGQVTPFDDRVVLRTAIERGGAPC
jgi:UDP-N-acetylmuramoyl-L-alanyl-D-glutamate--2,6-diaminopimelate ligase